MKRIVLDVSCIETVRALHIYLAYQLDFPAYYGKNLDALHDLLTEMGEKMSIVLRGKACSEEMAAYLPRLERVFEDCAEENAALEFTREI